MDLYHDAPHGINERKQDTGLFGGYREPVRGRKWDHVREGDPVIMRSEMHAGSSPWRTYIKASMYGPGSNEDVNRVDEEFLRAQTPGYEKPWRGDLENTDDRDTLMNLLHSKKRQRSLFYRTQV